MKKIISVLVLSFFSHLSYCQISEQSTPIRSNSYVQPFDIELATKVMLKRDLIYKERNDALVSKFKYLKELLDLFPEGEVPDKLLTDCSKLAKLVEKSDLGDYNSYAKISASMDYIINETKNELRNQIRR